MVIIKKGITIINVISNKKDRKCKIIIYYKWKANAETHTQFQDSPRGICSGQVALRYTGFPT
jgi:hypothetical protein